MAWTLFSSVVGAGFASGRELVLFLGSCEPHRGWAALLTGCLIGLVAALPEPAPPSPPGRGGTLFEWWRLPSALYAAVTRGLAWATLVAMVAALAHLVAPTRETALGPLAVAAVAVWLGAAVPAHRGLVLVSRVLGPAMAAAILLEGAIWGLAGPAPLPAPTSRRPMSGPTQTLGSLGCLEGTLIYAAGNAAFARVALEELVRVMRLPGRDLSLASAAGGGLVGAVAAAGLTAVERAGTWITAMPLLEAASDLHPAAGAAHRLVLAAAAYTTAVAGASALSGWLPQWRPSPQWGHSAGTAVGAAVVVLSTLPVAREGFVEAVQTLYPLAGWTALVALALRWGFAIVPWRRLY